MMVWGNLFYIVWEFIPLLLIFMFHHKNFSKIEHLETKSKVVISGAFVYSATSQRSFSESSQGIVTDSNTNTTEPKSDLKNSLLKLENTLRSSDSI